MVYKCSRKRKKNQNTKKRNKRRARKTFRRVKGGAAAETAMEALVSNNDLSPTDRQLFNDMENQILKNYIKKTENKNLINNIHPVDLSKKCKEYEKFGNNLKNTLEKYENLWFYDLDFMKEAVEKNPRVMQFIPQCFFDNSEYVLKEFKFEDGKNLISIFSGIITGNDKSVNEKSAIKSTLKFYDYLKDKIVKECISVNVGVLFFMSLNKYHGYCPFNYYLLKKNKDKRFYKSREMVKFIIKWAQNHKEIIGKILNKKELHRLYNGLEIQSLILPNFLREEYYELPIENPEYPLTSENSDENLMSDLMRYQDNYHDVVESKYKYYLTQNYKKNRSFQRKEGGEIKDSGERDFKQDKSTYIKNNWYGFNYEEASLFRYNAVFIFEAFKQLGGVENFYKLPGFEVDNRDTPITAWVKNFITCCILNTIYFIRDSNGLIGSNIKALLETNEEWEKIITDLDEKIGKNKFYVYGKKVEKRICNTTIPS